MCLPLKHSAGAEDVAQLVDQLQETLIFIPSIALRKPGMVVTRVLGAGDGMIRQSRSSSATEFKVT